MSNQVEKATTVIQAYVSPSERRMVQQAVDAANERISQEGGQRPFSESLWVRSVLVREAKRVAGRGRSCV